MKRRAIQAVKDAIEILKVTASITIIAGMIIFLLMSLSAPTTHTFTEDGLTPATSTDGTGYTIIYEVEATYTGDNSRKMRTDAMRDINAASMCANQNIDSYIESSNDSQINGKKLNEQVSGCGDDEVHVTISRYRYSYVYTEVST